MGCVYNSRHIVGVEELSFYNIIGYYRSTGRLVGGLEQNISRILSLHRLSTTQVAIIYLGRQLPGASCNQPES